MKRLNWGNRRPFVFSMAIMFSGFAFFLLLSGAIVNPDVQGFFAKPSQPQIKELEKQFDLPSYLLNGPQNHGLVDSSATTTEFVIGNGLQLNLLIHLWNFKYPIDRINVEPTNCLLYIGSESNTNTTPISSKISMFQIDNATWFGSQMVVPQTTGTLTISITIFYFSSPLELKNYTVNMELSNMIIGTGIETQQRINESRNLSLTLFVLFFASLDIAVVLYDHSEKDNDKANREKREAAEQEIIADYEGYG